MVAGANLGVKVIICFLNSLLGQVHMHHTQYDHITRTFSCSSPLRNAVMYLSGIHNHGLEVLLGTLFECEWFSKDDTSQFPVPVTHLFLWT